MTAAPGRRAAGARTDDESAPWHELQRRGRLLVEENVAVEEFRRPVQDISHGCSDALERFLAPGILLALARLLLALENDDHEQLGWILLAAHDQGLQEPGVLLLDGTQLPDRLGWDRPARRAGSVIGG